jgi:hypothetical protein
MPSCFGASGSVRTSMNICVAPPPWLVQIFWPLMIHLVPSADNSPFVRTEARSLPEPGSE